MKDLQVILAGGAVTAARELIGWRLYVKEDDGSLTGGAIIEAEAYAQEDAASHSFHGQTPRTEIMFGPAGRIYVYFTYGMHWCMNIVTGIEGHGEAVLIRAIEPEEGIVTIRQRRGNRPDSELTNGPAKVCQALGVSGIDLGAVVNESRFVVLPPIKKYKTKATERIGIKKDTHRLWRFTGLALE